MVKNWGWPAIGIDLGARFSRVAVWQHGKVEIIVNDQGNRKTPSYVAFTDNHHLIGDAAKNQSTQNPANTIFDANKLIGRTFSDVTVQYDIKSWPFKVIAGANDKPKIVVSFKGEEKQFAAEEICSMILIKLKETAEAYLGVKVKYAVITVPAYFDDSQRQATKDAGIMAGLKFVHIINEPTAVTLAYGLHKKIATCCLGNNVLVFNMGSRTLDVSLLTINKNIVEFRAVNWNSQLGGDAFDRNMANYLIKVFEYDISVNAEHYGRLVAYCEWVKRTLSTRAKAAIDLYCDDQYRHFSSNLTRARFERLNEGLFKECMCLIEKCLVDAKMERRDVHYVVLDGGSTRIPKVQQMLQEFFHGKVFCNSINTEEVVAYGAAIHAAMLSRVIDNSPICPRTEKELHLGAAVEERFLIPCKRTRSALQSRVQESSSAAFLQDIDSLLEDLSKVSKKKTISLSSAKTRFFKLLEEIRCNPNDLQLTKKMSQLLKDFHPSLPMNSLTVIKSLEEDLLASQHQFMEWSKKEVAAPLKLEEAGTIQSQLTRIKTNLSQKTSSRDQLRLKIAETEKEIVKLKCRKSQFQRDLSLADQDLDRLTRSISPQVDVARQKSAQLVQLREVSNFKAQAWISVEAALDSIANYLKNL
ncbi:heat shock 70 kDa protein 18-like [Chenopodium quinoa]|uniref:heat shock 70 kDa protein 18-like n=1 Tax=Chenopodium quinoa TaxID=63459 RepID=UPI000B778946|nr:heat shock 70 kDa protein 18-like [Chenopodium quinoa]